MDAQELRNLQEAYMEVVMNELDEGRGDDLRQKYGLNPGEASARLSNRAERIALNIGGRTHFERKKRDPLLRLSGLSRSRSRGETPTDPRRNSQGQLRDIRSRGGRPSNVYDGGANRDRGDKGERLAKFVSGKRNNPNMTDSERRTAHHNREEYDLYDIILSHLLDEGYAESYEAAEAIMVNMSEEWRDEIIDEAYVDYRKGKLPSGRTPQTALKSGVERAKVNASREQRAGGSFGTTATPSWKRAKKADAVGREMDAHTGLGGKINKALSPGLGNRPGAGPRVAYGEPNTDRHQGARSRRGQSSTKD